MAIVGVAFARGYVSTGGSLPPRMFPGATVTAYGQLDPIFVDTLRVVQTNIETVTTADTQRQIAAVAVGLGDAIRRVTVALQPAYDTRRAVRALPTAGADVLRQVGAAAVVSSDVKRVTSVTAWVSADVFRRVKWLVITGVDTVRRVLELPSYEFAVKLVRSRLLSVRATRRLTFATAVARTPQAVVTFMTNLTRQATFQANITLRKVFSTTRKGR